MISSSVRFCAVALILAFSGPAHADNFRCALFNNSTQSNDPKFTLPADIATSFDDQGQSVTISNTQMPALLNCRLPIEDHMNGAHLLFGATGVEGISREADILAGSIEDFSMTIRGEDLVTAADGTSTHRTWSGDYECGLVHH